MNTQILKEVGLTPSEIKVYVSALKLSPASAGEIVHDSGLQNAAVHRVFHTLVDKGLLSFSMEGKTKKYQARPPKRFLEILEDKRKQVAELIPDLEASRNQERDASISTTYKGLLGVRELWNVIIDTESQELLSYGAPGKSHNLLGDPFWKAHHRKRDARHIKSRHIFNLSLKWRGDEMNKAPNVEVRYTEKEFEGMTETAICGDRVAIVIYLDKPVGFLIEEALVADSYRQFFKYLWKIAEK